MKLDGGIDEYSWDKRINDSQAPKGRKVYFKNKGGYDSELGQARCIFKEGQVLTVEEIYVGRNSSTVEFEGISGRFNTVMFGDINMMSDLAKTL